MLVHLAAKRRETAKQTSMHHLWRQQRHASVRAMFHDSVAVRTQHVCGVVALIATGIVYLFWTLTFGEDL